MGLHRRRRPPVSEGTFEISDPPAGDEEVSYDATGHFAPPTAASISTAPTPRGALTWSRAAALGVLAAAVIAVAVAARGGSRPNDLPVAAPAPAPRAKPSSPDVRESAPEAEKAQRAHSRKTSSSRRPTRTRTRPRRIVAPVVNARRVRPEPIVRTDAARSTSPQPVAATRATAPPAAPVATPVRPPAPASPAEREFGIER